MPLEEFNRLKETNQSLLEKQKITANKKEDLEEKAKKLEDEIKEQAQDRKELVVKCITSEQEL